MANKTIKKENISISIPVAILAHLDNYCERTELDRSYVVTKAIKMFLASELASNPFFWEELYAKYNDNGKL